jgi:hypothetical protein
MHWQIIPASFAFFFTAVITFGVACIIWRRRQLGTRSLTLLMLAVTEWSIMAGLDVSATDQAVKIYWSKIEYLGIASSPVFLLLFGSHQL